MCCTCCLFIILPFIMSKHKLLRLGQNQPVVYVILKCGCPGVAEEPVLHSCTLCMCGVTRLGRMEEPDIGMLRPRKWTSETSYVVVKFLCERMCPWDWLSQTNPLNRSEKQPSWMSAFWTCMFWGSGSKMQRSKIGHNPPIFLGTRKYRL